MVIYKTINLINQKIYIGQTTKSIDNYYGSGKIINKALLKYGKSNFKVEILDYCKNKEELNEREKYWILLLNSTDHNIGYNISDGGQGGNLGEDVSIKKSKSLKEFFRKNPDSHLGQKNPRFDKNIYTFYNIETNEIFIGYKYDLANIISSKGSDLNVIIKGYRERHKNWILEENKDKFTKEYFRHKKSIACKIGGSMSKKQQI